MPHDREASNNRSKAYYAKNREKLLATRKHKRLTDPKVKQYSTNYYIKNRDRLIQQALEWYYKKEGIEQIERNNKVSVNYNVKYSI